MFFRKKKKKNNALMIIAIVVGALAALGVAYVIFTKVLKKKLFAKDGVVADIESCDCEEIADDTCDCNA